MLSTILFSCGCYYSWKECHICYSKFITQVHCMSMHPNARALARIVCLHFMLHIVQSIKIIFKTSASMSTMWTARCIFMKFWNKRKCRDLFVADDRIPFKSEWTDSVFAKQKLLFQDHNGLDDFQLPAVWITWVFVDDENNGRERECIMER